MNNLLMFACGMLFSAWIALNINPEAKTINKAIEACEAELTRRDQHCVITAEVVNEH